jgi:hypothetical protein
VLTLGLEHPEVGEKYVSHNGSFGNFSIFPVAPRTASKAIISVVRTSPNTHQSAQFLLSTLHLDALEEPAQEETRKQTKVVNN